MPVCYVSVYVTYTLVHTPYLHGQEALHEDKTSPALHTDWKEKSDSYSGNKMLFSLN